MMQSNKLRDIVGFNVRKCRLRKEFSQEALAGICGLNRSYIGAIERGEHNIGVDNLSRLATGLEVPVVRLFDSVERCAASATLEATGKPAQAILSRKQFLQLLEQCAMDRPDLVAVYLNRCGVRFIE
jgi:transcriptional regulator with XRE-family HTH domain